MLRCICLVVFLILPLCLFSQIDEGTFNGNIKSVREQLFFLDSTKQNLKLFRTEGDYGHNGFVDSEYTFSRFNSWWFHTPWVHYLNYYKEFDKDENLIMETWYYKDNSQVRKFFYKYDDKKNLIQRKTAYNDTLYLAVNYNYHKNKLVSTISYNSYIPNVYEYVNYLYDEHDRLIEDRLFDENGENYSKRYEYDVVGNKTKYIDHSPFIWIEIDENSKRQKRDVVGYDYVNEEYFYDDRNNLVEVKSYNENFLDNKQPPLYSVKTFKYDKNNRKTAEYYSFSTNAVSSYREYKYYKNNKIKSDKYFKLDNPKDNSEIKYFYDKKGLIEKVFYVVGDKKTIIEFEYKFDEENNWIEQLKIINGEPLYLRRRDIKYQ